MDEVSKLRGEVNELKDIKRRSVTPSKSSTAYHSRTGSVYSNKKIPSRSFSAVGSLRKKADTNTSTKRQNSRRKAERIDLSGERPSNERSTFDIL